MSLKRRNFQNLWTTINSTSSKRNHNVIKALNLIDEDSDVSTSIDQYTETIAQGMVSMIERGLVRADLIHNEKFFEKLMDLGRSIMNGAKDSRDLFTLGLLVDGQISKKFLNLKFYKLILSSLSYIRKQCKLFTQEFIEKIEKAYVKSNNQNALGYLHHYRKSS